MSSLSVSPASRLEGVLTCPGDKSISHRAFLIGALAQGASRITEPLQSGDLMSTTRALEELGVRFSFEGGGAVVEGRGRRGLRAPSQPLEMGNSGTTTRLLLGILAGHSFSATLQGDFSLSQRPMRRVTEPLRQMGAEISGPEGGDRLPLVVRGGRLRGIRHVLPVASAQVKSAILLAGLFAEGKTTVVEPVPTRDHTERMLRCFGARLRQDGPEMTVEPGPPLQGRSLRVPGDFSSAAFFWVGALIVPGSRVTVQGVGLNPTRTGLLDLLRRMGAKIEIAGDPGLQEWEPCGEVRASFGPLQAVTVEPEMVPRVIDELPVFMVAATQAQGRSVIQGAGELKLKETDRIHSMVTGLTAMGGRVWVEGESILIEGPTRLQGASVSSFGDHRTAMALAIAGLAAEGTTTVEESQWIDISFPDFPRLLETLRIK